MMGRMRCVLEGRSKKRKNRILGTVGLIVVASSAISIGFALLLVTVVNAINDKDHPAISLDDVDDWVLLGMPITGQVQDERSGSAVALAAGSWNSVVVASASHRRHVRGTNSGDVRIYEYHHEDTDADTRWENIGVIPASIQIGDHSGYAVALSSQNGRYLVWSAPYYNNNDNNQQHVGRVQVFQRNGTATSSNWEPAGQTLQGEDAEDFMGFSVACSADGSVVAIGSPCHDNPNCAGKVHVYNWMKNNANDNDKHGSWTLLGNNKPTTYGRYTGERMGFVVALSDTGTILAAGSPYQPSSSSSGPMRGAVSVFELSLETGASANNNHSYYWNPIGVLHGVAPGDMFGNSVALSGDGKILAVGAPYHDGSVNNNSTNVLTSSGQVCVFQRSREDHHRRSDWQPMGDCLDGMASSDWFGWSLALSSDGNIIAAGARNHDSAIAGPNAGHVRVFEWNNRNFVPLGQPIDGEAANDYSGWSVALSRDGLTVAIGSRYSSASGGGIIKNSGHVRVFRNNRHYCLADDDNHEHTEL